MLRDASHRQAIQKFSFISSLNLSRVNQRHSRSDSSQFLATQTSKETAQQTAAIVTTSEATATIDRNWYEPTPDYSLSLAEIINATTENRLKPSANSTASFGKIIFALACSYGLFVSYWVFGHQGSKILTLLTGGKQVVLSQSEVEFIDYMERSLARIDRQIAAQDDGEVVYVPVYTPSPTPNNSLPTVSQSPNPPAISEPQPAPTAPLAIPAPPPLPSPPPVAEAENTAIAAKPKPQIDHTLIGVLELGNRSAVLVEVGGKTRRIWLGEKIHTDGWILKSIGDRQATISHEGQVRSISVGETF